MAIPTTCTIYTESFHLLHSQLHSVFLSYSEILTQILYMVYCSVEIHAAARRSRTLSFGNGYVHVNRHWISSSVSFLCWILLSVLGCWWVAFVVWLYMLRFHVKLVEEHVLTYAASLHGSDTILINVPMFTALLQQSLQSSQWLRYWRTMVWQSRRVSFRDISYQLVDPTCHFVIDVEGPWIGPNLEPGARTLLWCAICLICYPPCFWL